MRLDGKTRPDAYHFSTWQLSLAERGFFVRSPEEIDALLTDLYLSGNSLAKTGQMLGMSKQTVKNHLARLGVPLRPCGGVTEDRAAYIVYRGNRRRVTELAQQVGLRYDTIRHRIKKGWSIERAIETPLKPTPQKEMEKS